MNEDQKTTKSDLKIFSADIFLMPFFFLLDDH